MSQGFSNLMTFLNFLQGRRDRKQKGINREGSATMLGHLLGGGDTTEMITQERTQTAAPRTAPVGPTGKPMIGGSEVVERGRPSRPPMGRDPNVRTTVERGRASRAEIAEDVARMKDPATRQLAAGLLLKPEKTYRIEYRDKDDTLQVEDAPMGTVNERLKAIKKAGGVVGKKQMLYPIWKVDKKTRGIIEDSVVKNKLPGKQKDGWKLGDYQAITKPGEQKVYYTEVATNSKIQVIKDQKEEKSILKANATVREANKNRKPGDQKPLPYIRGKTPVPGKAREITFTNNLTRAKVKVAEGSPKHTGLLEENIEALKAGKSEPWTWGALPALKGGETDPWVVIPAYWNKKTLKKRPGKKVRRSEAEGVIAKIEKDNSWEKPESRDYYDKDKKKQTFKAVPSEWPAKDEYLRSEKGGGHTLEPFKTPRALVSWKTPDGRFVNLAPGVQPPAGSTKTTETQYKAEQERQLDLGLTIEEKPGEGTRGHAKLFNERSYSPDAYLWLKNDIAWQGDKEQSTKVNISGLVFPGGEKPTGQILSKYAKANNVSDEGMVFRLLIRGKKKDKKLEASLKVWLKKKGLAEDAFDKPWGELAEEIKNRRAIKRPGESREDAMERWEKEYRMKQLPEVDIKEPLKTDLPEELVGVYAKTAKVSTDQADKELKGIIQKAIASGVPLEEVIRRLFETFSPTGGPSGGSPGGPLGGRRGRMSRGGFIQ